MLTALMKNRIVIASVALCAGFLLAYLVLPPDTYIETVYHDLDELLEDGIPDSMLEPKDGVHVIVEEMPELVGGMAAIQSKVTYPESAVKADVEGRVFVQFVVNEEGDVQDVVVTRGVSSDLDEEAVRVVSEAKFTPGMQDGEPVKVRLSIPITFKLKPDDISAEAAVTPQDDIYVVVEHMPELVGGLNTLMQDIKYPEIAHKAGIEGKVIVGFVVNEDGTTGSVVVEKGIGAGCDEEAVRAVSKAKFTPGMQDGQPVKVRMVLPITFQLAQT
jgi:TonB family protein